MSDIDEEKQEPYLIITEYRISNILQKYVGRLLLEIKLLRYVVFLLIINVIIAFIQFHTLPQLKSNLGISTLYVFLSALSFILCIYLAFLFVKIRFITIDYLFKRIKQHSKRK